MAVYSFTKSSVNSDRLSAEIESDLGVAPTTISWSSPDSLDLTFASALSTEDQDTLTTTVADHVSLTTAESVSSYITTQVRPFVHQLVCTMMAENIAMGITQAGKSGHVLSLFTKQYPIPSTLYPNSLKSCLDTGSLYVALAVIQYIRDNPLEYTGLDPYITDARLAAMQDSINAFLA